MDLVVPAPPWSLRYCPNCVKSWPPEKGVDRLLVGREFAHGFQVVLVKLDVGERPPQAGDGAYVVVHHLLVPCRRSREAMPGVQHQPQGVEGEDFELAVHRVMRDCPFISTVRGVNF
jgi:hypothetical protein